MQIFPLAKVSREAAIFHADVHLRHAQIVVNKIISDALHFKMGKDIPTKVNSFGESEFWIKGTKILPKSGDINVWSKWAALSCVNAWWLVDFAFQLNNEIKFRFGVKDTTNYLRLQGWVVKGALDNFPKPAESGQKTLMEFPVVLPNEWTVKLGVDVATLSVIEIYRKYYFAQKGKVRMKWTKRETPEFMFPDGDVPF